MNHVAVVAAAAVVVVDVADVAAAAVVVVDVADAAAAAAGDGAEK